MNRGLPVGIRDARSSKGKVCGLDTDAPRTLQADRRGATTRPTGHSDCGGGFQGLSQAYQTPAIGAGGGQKTSLKRESRQGIQGGDPGTGLCNGNVQGNVQGNVPRIVRFDDGRPGSLQVSVLPGIPGRTLPSRGLLPLWLSSRRLSRHEGLCSAHRRYQRRKRRKRQPSRPDSDVTRGAHVKPS